MSGLISVLLNLYKGRISRKSFILSYLLLLAIALIYFIFGVSLYTKAGLIIFFVLLIPFFYIAISLHIRRLHDVGLSGWFILVAVGATILGRLGETTSLLGYLIDILYWLVLIVKVGEEKDNEYGTMPRQGSFFEILFNFNKKSNAI